MTRKKYKNIFVDVELLNGNVIEYQIPNDLQKPMRQAWFNDEGFLKNLLLDALINVPTSRYKKNGSVKLHLGRIVGVHLRNKKQYLRTRGQFLIKDAWHHKLDKAQIKFLLHDHSFLNKCRIRFDLFRWQVRFASKTTSKRLNESGA